MPNRPTVFSGIQPSGNLHLGNYLGAIKNWLTLQDQYNCFFCIVDQHAITVPQDPITLRQKIKEFAAIYLAAGIDPAKSTIFVQSHVPAHSELGWILSTITKVSEMKYMTQFKEKSQKQQSPSLGLLSYPVLMAADILLYNTNLVPVGDDQTQHLELTRTLAKRFNNRFGQTFTIPKQFTPKIGARIMALDNPEKKMSKSAVSPANYIGILDSPQTITKKIKRAVTDSDNKIIYDKKNKAGISNLMEIYNLISNTPLQKIEEQYQNKGYGDFKNDLIKITVDFLSPIQAKISSYSDEILTQIFTQGAAKASAKASAKLAKVKEKIGFFSI